MHPINLASKKGGLFMGWYSKYSYIVDHTEYVSDTEYYELQEDDSEEQD